jgi:hypothetical protein
MQKYKYGLHITIEFITWVTYKVIDAQESLTYYLFPALQYIIIHTIHMSHTILETIEQDLSS